MTRTATFTTALVLALAGNASAAGPGDVFPTGGLALPPGAIPGGAGGLVDHEPTGLGISEDGRYVAFAADADSLSAAAHPDITNVFRKDRATGAVVLVSRADGPDGAIAARNGQEVGISDDGARVAWLTRAALDPADADTALDVYVRDVSGDTTLLATPGTADDVHTYDLSGDGAYVAFTTTAALAGGDDANGVSDVYRRRLSNGALELVSRKAGAAAAGNAQSLEPSISDDGRWVAYKSHATDLVAGYVAGAGGDVFARDIDTATGYLVSNQAGAAGTGANGPSRRPQIAGAPAAAADVRIAYSSDATNVTFAGLDTSDADSVYRRSFSGLPVSALVSRADGFGGANADSRAHVGGISDSGQRIAFASDADNLTAAPDYYGAYVRDIGAGTTVLASADTRYAVEPVISDEGESVAWLNGGGGITADSDPDLAGVFARDYPAGPPDYVSRPPGSAPFLAPVTSTESPEPGQRTISADGRYVVFAGYSSHLPGNEHGPQVYRRDTLTGALELVSRADGPDGAPAERSSRDPSISADGRRVAFASFARLDPADTDDNASVYVRDLGTGATLLASRADGPDGALADDDAEGPRISAGGDHVTFLSRATNLGAPGAVIHLYLRDLGAGRTRLVDRATGADGAIASLEARSASVSGDGRLVAFSTRANNLDPADPAPGITRDVYVRDTVAETTVLASRLSGPAGAKATGESYDPVLSADGRVLAFVTGDDAVAPEGGPWGGTEQVVARELESGANRLVSRAATGAVADATSGDASVDGDGSVIAFSSAAANLIDGVGGGSRHGVFAREMATGALSGPPAFGLVGNEPQDRAWRPSLSDDGQCMAFDAIGHNAFAGAAGDFRTGYVYVISGACPKPGPEPGAPVAPAGAASRPAITNASLTRKRFRVGRRSTARVARARKGTAFRFDLSASAEVRIAIARRASGRKVGTTCRKPARRLRKRPQCVRFVPRGTLVRGGLAAGRHRIAFSGRIGRKALAPGRYRAVLKARNEAGSSQPVKLRFRVVRR